LGVGAATYRNIEREISMSLPMTRDPGVLNKKKALLGRARSNWCKGEVNLGKKMK
jgi:hypothetical protein